MSEWPSEGVTELVEALRREAVPSKAGVSPAVARARQEVLVEAADLLVNWSGLPTSERGDPETLLAEMRRRAMQATWDTRKAKGEREAKGGDAVLAAVRSARWRVVFVLAKLFELDPFGRTAEEAEERERERHSYQGPRCAGVRKSGRPCRAIPRRGEVFCHHHQDQDPAYEPAVEPAVEPVAVGQGLDPEGTFDAEVDRWLAQARPRPGR
jgi:hypothetical protein